MCLDCKPLIKAIDAYIEKENDNLADVLREEGYIEPGETLDYAQGVEDDIAEILIEETDYILAEANKAADLEEFAEKWPDIKENDSIDGGVAKTFLDMFTKFMPQYIGYYLAKTDKELKLDQVSKRTSAWVRSWSRELGNLMKLNSHKEIEQILERGLQNGKGVDVFTREIMDSGIRNEYYRARRVALTEVLRAHSVAQQEAFMQSPSVGEKAWRHTGSYRNNPRRNHEEMDGQRVPVNEPFTLRGIKGGTYSPMYPRDINLPPEEAINCHCICQPVVKREVFGLSLEERQKLQREAVADMDDEWEKELDARNRAKAGIDPDAPGGVVHTPDPRAGITANGDKYSYHPETIAGVGRGEEMDFLEADSRRGNPGYMIEKGCTTNCQTAVVAHEARMRGYDVEAKGRTGKRDKMYELAYETRLAWIDPDTGTMPEYEPKKKDYRYNYKTYHKYLEDTVQQGARYTLRMSWRGFNYGHIVCVDRDADGALRIYDPQTGDINYGSGIDRILKMVRYTRYGVQAAPDLLRVDRLSFNEGFVQEILREERDEWKRENRKKDE